MTSATGALVSIVIPTFNDRDWICDAIDSALMQTWPRCEIVVVDDGSTDDTETLVRSRYGQRVRYIRQENRGLGAARNAGLAVATGDYVQFLDADDLLLPSKVATQVRALEDHPEYSVAYSDFAFVEGSDTASRMPSQFTDRYRSGDVWENLLKDNFIVVHAALSRRADILSVHGFDESLRACEDYDLWLRLAASGRRFLHTPEVLALYRRRPGSMSRNMIGQIEATIDVVSRVASYATLDVRMRGVQRRRLESLRRMMVRSLALGGYARMKADPLSGIALFLRAALYQLAGAPRRALALARGGAQRLRARIRPLAVKREGELRYWQDRREVEGTLRSGHYEWLFTEHFGIDRSDYRGMCVLDVGCGPRGSLEWADMTAQRIGADPLAHAYQELGARDHAMRYVCASADALPFPGGHFDIVSAFNSLDHVDDLTGAVRELSRVLKPGGRLLLLAEVNHAPTIVEPITLTWEAPALFRSLTPVVVRHYEMGTTGMFHSLHDGRMYDHADATTRTGVVSALLCRPL